MTAPTTPPEQVRDVRRLALGGGLVLALALGAGWYLLGSDAEVPLAAVTRSVPSAVPAAPTAPAVTTLPAAAVQRQGHNPFRVLYQAPAAAGSVVTATGATSSGAAATGAAATGATSTGATATGATTTPTAGSSPGTVVPGTPLSTAAASAPGTGQPAGSRVWLRMGGGLDPAERARNLADGTWTFRVGTTSSDPAAEDHVVAPGEDFATYFRLLKLSYDAAGDRSCAKVQFGDSTLTLCEADTRDLLG